MPPRLGQDLDDRGQIVRAVQLIYSADAITETLELPALHRQSALLKGQLNQR
jgi:hypothetical protein